MQLLLNVCKNYCNIFYVLFAKEEHGNTNCVVQRWRLLNAGLMNSPRRLRANITSATFCLLMNCLGLWRRWEINRLISLKLCSVILCWDFIRAVYFLYSLVYHVWLTYFAIKFTFCDICRKKCSVPCITVQVVFVILQYEALKQGREPDLSDYKEFKLREDNVGFQMLQKLGWTEGQGLGPEGGGITDPVNKSVLPLFTNRMHS